MGINDKNNSLDGASFVIFIEIHLCFPLSMRAVVVMENLPAHKVAFILPKIEAVGVSVLYLFHTLAYFNPIEQWLSQLNFFFSGSLPLPRP
jgi:putative transposase